MSQQATRNLLESIDSLDTLEIKKKHSRSLNELYCDFFYRMLPTNCIRAETVNHLTWLGTDCIGIRIQNQNIDLPLQRNACCSTLGTGNDSQEFDLTSR